jgi:multiple antibiotic resistance protein
MPDLATFTMVTFSAVFFVVDPFAVIPLFLAITKGDSPEKRRRTALKASVVTVVTLLVFAATGEFIFRLFGITVGAFKIAGGLLLFLVSLDMLRAQPSRVRSSPEEEREGFASEDVAIVPLAIPMLAGPGAIATVTVLMSQAAHAPTHIAVVVAVIVVTGLLTLFILRGSTALERLLKQTGLNIVNRVMGLILAAVSVQFVVNGVHDVLPLITAKG